MDCTYTLLDLPVSEGKDMGEGRVIYPFEKDEHAKLLLNNLAEMQANKGLLTDVKVRTMSQDYEEPFHSMLLAACSPIIKQRLTGKHFDCTAGVLTMKDLTAEVLKAFRDFLYKAKFPSNEELVDPLKAFAKRYGIDSLKNLCRKDKDQRSSDQEMLVWSSRHRKGVLSQLHEMFQRKELATTLLEDGEGKTQVAVHGPLVAAASPVLREILSNDLFSQNGAKYRLKEVPSNILGDLINYIYTGEVTLEGENVVGLLNVARSYEIPALGVACCDWLSWQLDSYNAVGILWLARKANNKCTKVLEEEAKNFIITNFANVCEEAEFDELGYDDLKEIIQHDHLCVNCEEDVFYAVPKWVEADEDGRSPYMEDLLQCVRLENTSLEFLSNLQEDPRIARSARCLQIVQNAQRKLVQALDQSGDTPGFVPQHFDNGEDVRRKLLSEFEDVSPRRGLRKNGQPDMRLKKNRQSLGLKKKDGTPDKRFKANKEADTPPSSQDGRPMKKDGTPDRRFKVNKETNAPSSSQKSSPRSGPVKKDGTPDMRFSENKTPNGGKSSPAPVKRDGTPDMRYAENTQSASPSPSSSYGGSLLTQLSSYCSPSCFIVAVSIVIFYILINLDFRI